MKDKIQDEKLRVIGECQQLALGAVIVNEPEHLDDMDYLPFYDWRVEEEGFLKGLTKKDGGILPDDNVRIYLPKDINSKSILADLNHLYTQFGDVGENNEEYYSCEVRKPIRFLEIYDSILLENHEIETVQTDDKVHTKLAQDTTQEMVKIMMENQGWAELFPYEECEQLADLFGFPFSL